ncbi:uncharacterized protein LOC124287661 [Haliotis rubra]|uniref:uncharacterized protein LOC124287661 n=1 Tax=Haliotis rubra TaxID=36100 RepID=UPI001EE534E4|nr:uncharacterized protein LOC124287661 [Haliotis rubra]
MAEIESKEWSTRNAGIISEVKLLDKLPKLTNRDGKKLYELSDLLMEIESLKANDKYSSLLSYFDTSSGVNPIVQKLPYGLQEKWSNHAFGYKQQHNVPYPPFSVLVNFIHGICLQKNDPSFHYDISSSVDHPKVKASATTTQIRTRRTDINRQDTPMCPLHNSRHSINDCKAFQDKPYQDKISFLKTKGICFKCCMSTDHVARACTEKLLCKKCKSTRHTTAIHDDDWVKPSQPTTGHGGEARSFRTDSSMSNNVNHQDPVSSKCTQICGGPSDTFQGKSCAKNVLVLVYPKGKREQATRMYTTIDDQSNASLCHSSFFTKFGIQGDSIPYTLSSCAGQIETSGRRASDYAVSSLDGNVTFDLPALVECNNIPAVKEEIPTPDVALHHSHLKSIAKHIPELDDSSQIELLLGRDLLEAHHILEQITGPRGSPYAQRLPLGWVIVGEACLGKAHSPQHVNLNKVYMLDNDRPSIFQPCPNNMFIKENSDSELFQEESDIFYTTSEDERSGTSVQDRQFLDIMDRDMYRNDKGTWVAPLPFMKPRKTLPNNKTQAIQRANMLDRSLQKNPEKRKHFMEFMQKIFDNRHAELAPPVQEKEECWYLLIFGVYHPEKPSQIRAVFDSSARYKGVSLNEILLQGPDLINELLGILLRFRREPVAILADIQQMFHCFEVEESHRNYLRFLWYKDNKFENELVGYRMRVHVFGNRPSPAVAAYGLRNAAQAGEKTFGKDTKDFVQNDFYVDDAVNSLPTPEQATDLLKRTQESLKTNGNLRLHKIISNSMNVMKSFPPEDLAKDLNVLDLQQLDTFPLQRSLGILWDVQSDVFTFRLPSENKPCTKRGILSTVNSIFDPMGFVAPVVIQVKLILRDVVSTGLGWDDIVPAEHLQRWEQWRTSLKALEQ